MKKRTILTVVMMLAACIGVQKVVAQKVDMTTGLVVWKGSTLNDALNLSSQGGFVYLIEFKESLNANDKEKYINAGGNYGVQAILSSVGMRMQIRVSQDTERPNKRLYSTAYQFVTRIDNPSTVGYLGDCMGYDNQPIGGFYSIYLDRGNKFNTVNNQANNFPNWTLIPSTQYKYGVRYKGEASPHPESVQTYTIRSTDNPDNYIRANSNGRLVTSNSNNATKWIIVTETDFNTAMQQVTWGEVDLGVFVQDAEFGRDNKDGFLWVWKNADKDNDGNTLDGWNLNANPQHWHQRNQDIMCNGVELRNGITHDKAGYNVAGNGNGTISHDDFRQSFGQYYAAEIYNEENSLLQTLHGATIPNLIDGLYKLTAQALYYDEGTGETNDGAAYFVIKRDVLDDNGNIVDTSTEYMPITPMKKVAAGNSITAHSGISAGYVFDNNENEYLLTAFVEISGRVNLTIGIEQRVATGWTVIGNLHLYAHGKQAMYVDENWTDYEELTFIEGDVPKTETDNPYHLARWHDNYDYPSTVYYQRTFAIGDQLESGKWTGAWNTICLPLDLTGRQVRQAFGADAKVCAFKGQSANRPSLIYFERARDLDQAENMDVTVIEAGKPYLIFVSNPPQHPDGITVEVGNGQYNHTMTITGKTYAIPGVIKKQLTAFQDPDGEGFKLRNPIPVVGNGGFTMVGSFYKKVITIDEINCEIDGVVKKPGQKDFWVVTRGNMYHLQGTRDWTIWATYAYVYLPVNSAGQAKELSIAIDDGEGIQEIATHIEGLYFDNGQNVEDNDVYTLSGTKVGKGTLDTLPKGIYILNGRKYVKK